MTESKSENTTSLTLRDLSKQISNLGTQLQDFKKDVDKRFDHVDNELVAIKGKINELIEVSNEGGLQGKKVIPFPADLPDAEEE